MILIGLCCVLGLCHSFKSCALPISLLLQSVFCLLFVNLERTEPDLLVFEGLLWRHGSVAAAETGGLAAAVLRGAAGGGNGPFGGGCH